MSIVFVLGATTTLCGGTRALAQPRSAVPRAVTPSKRVPADSVARANAGTQASVAETTSSASVSREEAGLAVRLAFANDRVRELLGGKTTDFQITSGPPAPAEPGASLVSALLSKGTSPTDLCSRSRCVVLCFWVKDRYKLVDRVYVDLTSKTVMLR